MPTKSSARQGVANALSEVDMGVDATRLDERSGVEMRAKVVKNKCGVTPIGGAVGI